MCRLHYQRVLRNGTTEIQQRTLADRYWSRVVRGAEGECWGWDGANSRGYGILSNPLGHPHPPLRATRVSWEIHNGPIPDGMLVCHRCDNPPCSNPDHLFLGTHTENMRDMIRKGRGRNMYSKEGL